MSQELLLSYTHVIFALFLSWVAQSNSEHPLAVIGLRIALVTIEAQMEFYKYTHNKMVII